MTAAKASILCLVLIGFAMLASAVSVLRVRCSGSLRLPVPPRALNDTVSRTKYRGMNNARH